MTRGLALVAPMGPGQGSVDVWHDGKLSTTVNLQVDDVPAADRRYSTAWNLWTTGG